MEQNTGNQPLGGFNNAFLLQFAATGMKTGGAMLKQQDTNTTGTDDLVGVLLDIGGDVVLAYQSGNLKTLDDKLAIIENAIHTYRESKKV